MNTPGLDRLATICKHIDDAIALLRRYVDEVPAFRSKNIGCEGSIAREQQAAHIEIEDAARKLLAACGNHAYGQAEGVK